MHKNIRKTKSYRCENLLKSQSRDDRPEVRKKSPEKKPLNDKFVRNRCCLVRPKQQDFSQTTEPANFDNYLEGLPHNKYISTLSEQYGFDPVKADTLTNRELKKMFSRNTTKVDTSSDFNDDSGVTAPKFVKTTDGTQWQNIDNIDEIDKFLNPEPRDTPIDNKRKWNDEQENMPANIHISEVPKVKVIAEKFSKFQRDNVELRRLEERVVCVEYDVFDKNNMESGESVQMLRAFFSIKPLYKNGPESPSVTALPSNIKHKFNITEDDLKKLNQKEIEIIDDKIGENKSYLEDLRRVLKRLQFRQAKKDKSSLDLKCLYAMAKREARLKSDVSVANFLSDKELEEVKDLILQRCDGSVHGISRRRLRPSNEAKKSGMGMSRSILSELFA